MPPPAPPFFKYVAIAPPTPNAAMYTSHDTTPGRLTFNERKLTPTASAAVASAIIHAMPLDLVPALDMFGSFSRRGTRPPESPGAYGAAVDSFPARAARAVLASAAMDLAARIAGNRSLGRGGFVLALDGCDALAAAKPGQFVMLRGEWGRDPLLPRAFSILRMRGAVCEILVKSVGRGTRMLEQLAVGATLHVLGPLGREFPVADDADWLVAGGVGLAP